MEKSKKIVLWVGIAVVVLLSMKLLRLMFKSVVVLILIAVTAALLISYFRGRK